jgi:hypothetical protein
VASRDSQTDAGRMGASPQTKASMSQDAIDMDPGTLAEEQANGGWTAKNKPVGATPMNANWPPDCD